MSATGVWARFSPEVTKGTFRAKDVYNADGTPNKRQANGANVLIRDRGGLILYACVGILPNWTYTDIVFVSASNQASARYQFQSRYGRFGVKEVAIAPAIGSEVQDSHGERLIVR